MAGTPVPLRQVVSRFAAAGVCVAFVFSLNATVKRLVYGSKYFDRLDITYPEIIALYFVALPIGGIFTGLMSRVLWRSPVGAVLLGIIGALPLYLGGSLLVSRGSSMWSSVVLGGTVIGTVLVGGGVSLLLWADSQKANKHKI